MLNRNTWRWLLIAALSIVPLVSGASVIQPLSGQSIKFTPDLAAGEDFLHINPPNAAGVSLNRFSAFNASEPIKLMNTPSYDPQTGTAISTSRLVVIVAPDIRLSSTIDIVGPATDIVFITNDSDGGSIECNGCVINNTLRLLLASAYSPNINAGMAALGRINAKGIVTLRSLYAPGSIGLDVVAGRVISSGEININQAAIKSGNGGFSVLPGGQYAIGTGSIDVFSGAFDWDYEARKIFGIGNSGSQYSLAGTFKAPRVYISSGHHLQFDGKIDTRVSALSAVSYQGQTHVPQEGAALQALSNGSGSGTNVILNGDLYSDNALNIRATKDVIVRPSADVAAPSVKLIAGEVINNDGNISGALVSLAGKEVLNEGLLNATAEVDIWAEMDLANQYGGVIRGPAIKLSSDGVVRNGSRTPYKTEAENRNNLFDFRISKLLNNLEFDREVDPLLLNSSNSGVYYILPNPFLVANSAQVTMPSDSSASIIGSNIVVNAKAFENINPYFVYAESGEVEMERDRVQQVLLSAEKELLIQGANSDEPYADYFLNSSAVVTVNEQTGTLTVAAERFINQRFRVSSVLDVSDPVSFSKDYTSSNNAPMRETTTTTTYQSKTVVYSPPGFVNVMGGVELDIKQYFVNLFGFVEVFNGAKIGAPILKNYGLQNQELNQIKVDSYPLHNSGDKNTSYARSVIKRPADLDSLFFVAGELNANASSSWFGTLNPFSYFVNEAASLKENELESMMPQGFSYVGSDSYGSYVEGYNYHNLRDIKVTQESLESIDEYGSVVVDWKYDRTEYKRRTSEPKYTPDYRHTDTISASKEYNLFSLLKEYYDLVKDKVTEIFTEFDWWGLAA